MATPGPIAAALAVVAVGVLIALHQRTAAREARQRLGLLDEVGAVFDDARPTADLAGLPALTGDHQGRHYSVRLIVDSLTLRKLPVLWLEVTLHRSLPLCGPLCALRRPQGTEFFSPDHAFAHELDLPPGWPRPTRLSGADPARAPDPAVLTPALALLHDPLTKEVAVGPRGARVVRLAAECEQAQYRTARRAVFGSVPIPRDEVRSLVSVLAALADEADRSAPDSTSVRSSA